MRKTVSILTIILLLLTGINALVAGALFIIDPSGQKMGMPVSYLSASPFRSFLVPGIVLFTVNGLMNVIAAISVAKKKTYSALFTIFQGIMLGGWIVVQVIMVRDINLLHIIMFSIGVLLLVCGWMLRRPAPGP